MCCGRAATSPACWSIRCRRCIPTPTRPAIPRWSTVRASGKFDRAAYGEWLKKLREVCTERGIVLIFDEVFVGFRLAAGGAQEYFGVRADMVTYGKSLAGGLARRRGLRPQGTDAPLPRRPSRRRLLCPRHLQFASLRHDGDGRIPQPARQPEFPPSITGSTRPGTGAPAALNERLAAQDLPVRVSNLSSIWMVHYTEPSRYNWMLQYYLRAEGLALSWVGTGRLIFSLNYTDADFAEVADRFVAAAEKMKRDGWWWHDAALTNKNIKRQILKEMLTERASPQR